MKIIALTILAAAMSSALYAQDTKIPVHYIKVTGHAEKQYEPTYVDVYINLAEKEKVNNNNSVADKERDLLNALKSFGVPAEKLRVQRLNTGEAYSMFGSKYYINKSYTLRIDDLNRYEDIILGLVDKGFKNIYISEIGMTDKEKKADDVMAAAVKNGISKAGIIATAAGIKTPKLLSIDETNEIGASPVMYKRMEFAAMDAGASNLPLGKINMQKDLTMVFEIE